jgi:hypothetical protein
MSLAYFRITQEEGQDTLLTADPYIIVQFASNGKVGTAQYKNEPIHLLIAAPTNAYPGIRWLALASGQRRIAVAMHTPQSDFYIRGKLADFKGSSAGLVQIFRATLIVESATQAPGGVIWKVLEEASKPKEEEDPGIMDDVLHTRGKKLAKRAGSWIWGKIKPW